MEIVFDQPIPHLLDALRERMMDPPPQAIFVSGLEFVLPRATEAAKTPFVANLNASRNSFPLQIHCPLVLWCPEYVVKAIAEGAPDFFSVRSGVYVFASPSEPFIELASLAMQVRQDDFDALSQAEKIQRIQTLERLLADSALVPPAQRSLRTETTLLDQEGRLFWALGDHTTARKRYDRILEIAREMGDLELEQETLFFIGLLLLNQLEFAKADEFINPSSEFLLKSGNLETRLKVLTSLGRIWLFAGQLEKAESLLQKAWKLAYESKNVAEQVKVSNSLGMICRRKNKPEEAAVYFQSSLGLAQFFQDSSGIAESAFLLGTLLFDQGRFVEAEELLRSSLRIYHEMGNQRGEIATLNDLAALLWKKGDTEQARMILRQIETLAESTANPHIQELAHSTLNMRKMIFEYEPSGAPVLPK